jgi:hypothetical protein
MGRPKRGFTLFVKRGITVMTLSRGIPTRDAALATALSMAATRPVGTQGMGIRCVTTGAVWPVDELVAAAGPAELSSPLPHNSGPRVATRVSRGSSSPPVKPSRG